MFYVQSKIFELRRPIVVKFCHMIVVCLDFIMQVQKYKVPFPEKNWSQEHAKFGAITDIFFSALVRGDPL